MGLARSSEGGWVAGAGAGWRSARASPRGAVCARGSYRNGGWALFFFNLSPFSHQDPKSASSFSGCTLLTSQRCLELKGVPARRVPGAVRGTQWAVAGVSRVSGRSVGPRPTPQGSGLAAAQPGLQGPRQDGLSLGGWGWAGGQLPALHRVSPPAGSSAAPRVLWGPLAGRGQRKDS